MSVIRRSVLVKRSWALNGEIPFPCRPLMKAEAKSHGDAWLYSKTKLATGCQEIGDSCVCGTEPLPKYAELPEVAI